MKALRIFILKRQVRTAYRQYMLCAGYLGCGNELADHITGGSVMKARDKCNRILDKLARIDPKNCPVTRLS